MGPVLPVMVVPPAGAPPAEVPVLEVPVVEVPVVEVPVVEVPVVEVPVVEVPVLEVSVAEVPLIDVPVLSIGLKLAMVTLPVPVWVAKVMVATGPLPEKDLVLTAAILMLFLEYLGLAANIAPEISAPWLTDGDAKTVLS